MKRPAWAASPGFSRVWSDAEASFANSRRQDRKEDMASVLQDMQDSEVLVIGATQIGVLPPAGETAEDIFNAFQTANLPFPNMFIDLSGFRTEFAFPSGSPLSLVACLLRESPDAKMSKIQALPIYEPPRFNNDEWEWPDRIFLGESLSWVRSSEPRAWSGQEECGPGDWATADKAASVTALERVLAVLNWLESVNVEVAEVPMKPVRRAREIQKGRKIALTIQVKQSKRRTSTDANGKANYSHRFETRGHYKHHFETKPNGEPNKVFEKYAALHPEKVLTIQGQPCVRFWTPPFVKGPIDKPFVPKVRVVESASAG